MSTGAALWLTLLLCLVILVWDLRVIVPGLILLAVSFVAALPTVQVGQWADLTGIALVPILGGIVCSMGSLFLASRFKPTLALRITGVLAIVLVPELLRNPNILLFLPAPLQELTILRMMFRLLLTGGLFLSLVEFPLHFGYGVLLIMLVVNALITILYEGIPALPFLLNLAELVTILGLGQQTLRFPLWLSVQEETQAP